MTFLREAGVRADHLQLAKRGIRGDGHLLPLELNNDQISAAIAEWIHTLT